MVSDIEVALAVYATITIAAGLIFIVAVIVMVLVARRGR